MKLTSNKIIWVTFLVFLIVLTIFWLILKSKTNNSISTNLKKENLNNIEKNHNTPSLQTNFSSISQQDTQINCQITANSSNEMIINEQTKNCFEYFLTQYGEKTIAQIKVDFLSYTQTTYKNPLLSRLNDLWSRYLEYRQQLQYLQAPNINHDSPDYYQHIFSNMKNLQKQFFSNYEIEGLFGQEDIYNEYTIKRIKILNNREIQTIQKAQKLKELFNELPEDWKENLQQLSQLEDLQKLTAEIKARGNSAEELYRMRINLVGPEATQRLENLDIQNNNWKKRVNHYLNERETILKSSMSDLAKKNSINLLRDQQFANPREQIRLQTFEQVHDQGGDLPFSN